MKFDITFEKVMAATLIAVMVGATVHGLYLMVTLLRAGHLK